MLQITLGINLYQALDTISINILILLFYIKDSESIEDCQAIGFRFRINKCVCDDKFVLLF